jgi:hypothetical protein
MKNILLNSFFLLLLFFSSCATFSHKVNFKEIKENKNKIFKLNMVKVVGCKGLYRDDYIEKKRGALEKIPIDKICNTLNSYYGLEIDTNINKTIQIAYECVECGFKKSSNGASPHSGVTVTIQPTCQNPYWGYIEPPQDILNNIIFKMFKKPKISQLSEIIEITYGCCQSDASRMLFDTKLEYQVIIKTKDKVLVKHRGIVESFKKQKNMWDNIVSYTDKINEALVRDINKTK